MILVHNNYYIKMSLVIEYCKDGVQKALVYNFMLKKYVETIILPPIGPPAIINIIDTNKHYCYLLYSASTKRTYIGYTVNLEHRLDQHNGRIVGGAKRTMKGRPWVFSRVISGFPDHHIALSFEWHWTRKSRGRPSLQKRINDGATLMEEFKDKHGIDLKYKNMME